MRRIKYCKNKNIYQTHKSSSAAYNQQISHMKIKKQLGKIQMIKREFGCPQGPKEYASFGLRNIVY